MTPPRTIRNFILGSSHPLPDLALNPAAEANLRLSASAISNQEAGTEMSRDEAADSILLGPSIRYRESLSGTYRDYNVERLETFIHDSLALARAGQRVSYYDTIAAHFSLLQRVPVGRISGVTRQFVSAIEEYSNFLQYAPGLSTEERMRFLFAAARILHTFWGYLERPPANLALPPETPELRRLLRQTLDEVDGQLQAYRGRLQSEGFPGLSRLDGVMEILALRRAMHAQDSDAQRTHALALADYLRNHPPLAADTSWEARGERSLLEDPEVLQQLQRFDIPALLEYRSTTLNAFSLELFVLAAAGLDRANEVEESAVQSRYRRLSAVLTVAILRHPESTLEEQLNRLTTPTEEASVVAELQEAESSSADLSHMIHEARSGQGLAELAVAARETALHLRELRGGLGAHLLPGILEANRRYHPLHRIAAQLQAQPQIASALNLPGLRPESELLRRGGHGISQVEILQRQNPALRLTELLHLLNSDSRSPHPTEDFSRDLLDAWQEQLHSAADHETFALYSLAHAVAENRELGNGMRLSSELRNRAQNLGARMDSLEFRSRRVLGHLVSPTNLLSVGAGILAAEFLPSLLISRAGAAGSLGFRGLSLVSRGTLTPWGSVLTGLGTGLATTAIGTSLGNIDRARSGLRTHWSRDFLSSGAVNLATFGLTLPVSNLLRNRLMPSTLSGEVTALSLNRRMILHAGTVAMGGATAWGLGYLGRGLSQGQWNVSGEEIAENVGSILLWEGGSAGLRGIRARLNLTERLGAYRAPRVTQLVDSMISRNGGLAPQRETLIRWLGREEYYNPGTLERFSAAQEANYMPILEGSGRSLRLRLLAPDRLPAISAAPAAPATPPPQAPLVQERVRVVIWERDRRPLLPANTTVETPSNQVASSPSEVEVSQPPIALEDSPFFFEVLDNLQEQERGGAIEFGDLRPIEGENSRILGRNNFGFLSPELQRTISRSHLEVTYSPDGTLLVRNLSRVRGFGEDGTRSHGSWYQRDNQWYPIPSDEPVTLLASDRLAIGGSGGEAVQFELRPNITPPLSLVTLGPRGVLRFGGMTVIRSGEGSLFRMGGPGGIPVEVTRSLGSEAGRPQFTASLDHPVILGEIGEEVTVAIGEGAARRTYRMRLDASDRPASWIPTIDLNYGGTDHSARLTAVQGGVNFGRAHQPELFGAPFISRNHFRIQVITQNGHPRYGLTVDSPYGLIVAGNLEPHGSRLALHAGFYQFGFPMDNSGRGIASPFNIRLPPIEGVFEEWGTGPLVPHHDRGIPPPPPVAPPPVPQAPVTMPPPAPRE